MDLDLNDSLGKVAMDEDKYTQKCDIIKVSLTEVILRREDLSAPADQTSLKVPCSTREPKPSRDPGPGTARLRTDARVDRSKMGDT